MTAAGVNEMKMGDTSFHYQDKISRKSDENQEKICLKQARLSMVIQQIMQIGDHKVHIMVTIWSIWTLGSYMGIYQQNHRGVDIC